MTEATAAPAGVPSRPRTWGLGDVVLGFSVGLIGAQVVLAAILGATDRTVDQVDELPLSLVAVAQMGLWLGLLGAPIVATRLKGNGLVADLHLRARLTDLWTGGLSGAGLQLVALPLLYWPLLRLLDKGASDLEGPAREMTDRADGVLGVALLIVIVGICAPIIEEIFYRGLFQQALRKRGLPPVAAIGISATVFGLSHGELLQLPALILFGIVAGVLAHRSGRLGPAIVAHVGVQHGDGRGPAHCRVNPAEAHRDATMTAAMDRTPADGDLLEHSGSEDDAAPGPEDVTEDDWGGWTVDDEDGGDDWPPPRRSRGPGAPRADRAPDASTRSSW